MQAHKALKTQLITFLLIVGSFISMLSPHPVNAEDAQGVTTLYFTEALTYENTSEFGLAFLSEKPPTTQNDSQYPPSLLQKNVNISKWGTWLVFWSYLLLGDFDYFPDLDNITDYLGDFEILLPNPYRVVETYIYNGNDSIQINGDVVFNLFFSQPKFALINSLPKFEDTVKIGFYSMNTYTFIPKLIKNTTITLNPEGLTNIYRQQITLQNVNHTIRPGDNLLFSIEIIPSNKRISNIINILDVDIITFFKNFANRLENRSRLQKIQNLGIALKEILSEVEYLGVNITSEDLANITNSMRSSKFVYDSLSHPSSVTIPAKIITEDIREYFLHEKQEMSEIPPNTTNESKNKLSTTPLSWSATPALDRNRILKLSDVSAYLYFYRIFSIYLGKITIVATLYDDNTTLATCEKELTKKDMNTLLRNEKKPIILSFTGEDKEINYGHRLRLSISLGNGTRFFPFFKILNIKYDSIDYPSSLRVKYQETHNIQIHDITTTPQDEKIIPGGNVQFIFNVTSIKTDTLQIETIEREKIGTWDVVTPSMLTISEDSWATFPVFVNSTNNLKEAYGDTINLIVVISGKTGIARQSISADVSTDAIQYKVEILQHINYINISRGGEHFFYFIIKNNNTGAIDDVDSYTITATSKNHWPLIPQETIRNLGIGDNTDTDDAKVLIKVPKNTTETSDEITITVTSESNTDATATITVKVNVIGGGVIEEILDFFDSTARSLGLSDMFGSDAKFVLLIVLAVIILFLLIIISLVITTKSVRIICTDRIKEIETIDKACFDLTLKNPSKKTQSYNIQAQQTTPSSKWLTTVKPPMITIDGRQTKTVQVITTPTKDVTPIDWTEIIVSVKKTGKKKTETITLLTMIKKGKTLLQLSNISHWPTVFNQGGKVITSCSLSNNGTITAQNVKVFFYLNGKQKNTLKVTIPPEHIADIQIPWIAEKGKNKIRIRVKE